MKLRLTTSQMLDQWRLRRLTMVPLAGCSAERVDGLDFDALEEAAMQEWYDNLIDTAPPSMLLTTDIKADLTVTVAADGHAVVPLPESCRRLLAVTMEGWHREAVIVTGHSSPLARLQVSPYSRGGPCEPVAVVGEGVLHLYTPPPGREAVITSAIAVCQPPEGIYTLDSRALSTIRPREIM